MRKDCVFSQNPPETDTSLAVFNQIVNQSRTSIASKFATANIKEYHSKAATSSNRILFTETLEFIGRHILDMGIANDLFMQFSSSVVPSDFMTLAHSISDQDLITLFR